ncbi:MAG: RnfABCDGE type electron transport complex subunit D [Gammaproteobacteria bacterium]|nr:RnfABCDGE type electron transport complex subunit D [Gammaproteobacteria bacterium]
MSTPAPDLHLSTGPHIRRGRNTADIMWLVNLSLAPALVWAVLVFGWPVLGITLASVAGCALAEHLFCKMRGTASTVLDGSVVCTGLLLAYTLPPGLPLWMPFVGGALGVFFSKSVFGGLGYNIFNVALVARAIMMATFPVAMTTAWLTPGFGEVAGVDALSGATPLVTLTGGREAAGAALAGLPEGMNATLAFFLGLRPGSVGEVSVLMIAAGAGFLLWQGIIKLTIPLSVLAGALVMSPWSPDPVLYMLSGGLWLGAFFMATDYVTSPSTFRGQVVFGLGIGLLTGMIRNWGGYPEGICYAILLMNMLTPALDEWFRPPRTAPGGTPS